MGMLIKGKLVENWLDKEIDAGEFKRMESTFRHWVTADGKAGPTGDEGFKAEQAVIISMSLMFVPGRNAPSSSEN